jgi:hypothetical protein
VLRIQRFFRLGTSAATVALVAGAGMAIIAPQAVAAIGTTAWQNGTFVVDIPNLVRRSDLVLGRPNTDPTQFMALGNGTLGVAAWAANGFTAQLNRADTFPDRKSPGQVVIPGLSRLTSAADFTGFLDLYDGMLHESGGGMTMTAYVRSDTAQLVVDVTGADPNTTQTAQVKLWSGRNPTAIASGAVAVLSQTWVDNNGAGNSGQTFGAMAAVTAGGRNVVASTPDSLTAQVSFQPNSNGSFRVIIAAPTWTGGDAMSAGIAVLNGDTTKPQSTITAAHLTFWHNYWNKAGLIRITSADGSGDYVENMRTLYLYDAAAQSRGTFPGTQAGVADLFNFNQDHQDWFPSGYWFWNLRMQVQANLSAGVFSLNDPTFRLYHSNVNAITSWTGSRMGGRVGMCVPETMRFNGNGTYNGGTDGGSCDQTITPTFNSLTITSGAEIGLWIWQTYLMTDDVGFLSTNYPVMSGAARFLLAYATTGTDGLLHTTANAHETQWNVTDPVTDILAMQALFPLVVQAAQVLNVDAALVNQLNAAIPKLPPLPRTDTATKRLLLTASADSGGADMIGWSTQPTAPFHNSENLGLEAVFPYNVIGDNSPLLALARRTYTSRSFVNTNDWTFDPLHAARLGLAAEVKSTLINATTSYQRYPSGLAAFNTSQLQEPYVEQAGVLAATVGEALVQDYDGLLRIAPAWPADWTGEGTVAIRHKSWVSVQTEGGTPSTVVIVSGSASPIAMRSPWPGQSVTVIDNTGATVVGPQSNASLTIPVQSGRTYLVERTSSPTTSLPFAAVTGSPASAARHLHSVTLGIDRAPGASVISLRAHANGKFVTAGSQPVIASSNSDSTAQQVDVLDAGNGNIALRAHANGMLITAENAGTASLIANRTAIGLWETFQLLHNPDGSVSFRALVNNMLVTAENAGAAPLIANRTAIGPWEEFDLINH